MKRKLAGAAITILLGGLAAGCGDDKGTDGGGTTTAAGALTKAQYIERADAICAAADARIAAAGEKLREAGAKSGGIPESEVVKFLRGSSVPAYERMLTALRDLTPPQGDETEINGFVASIAGALDAVKANPRKYAKRTTPDPFDDANRRARSYGMKVCGS